MKITKEEISPVDVRLTVAIEENDYKDDVTKKLKELGRTHSIPGFRKGHVPFGELKRRFGKQMTSDVINDTVYRAVVDFITENNLPVMGHPVPVEIKEAFEEGDQEFKYDLALVPQLDIKPSKDDHYPFYEIEVTDEMIDEQDKNMRKRFGKQEPGQEMTEDGVVKGAIMQLDENGNVSQAEGAIQVTDGIVFPLYFKDKEETAKFAGKKPGDKVVFNPWKAAGGDAGELASMLHVDKAIAGDIKGDFEMTISEIIVSVPAELGEEYYKMVFGEDKVHNEEEYRAAVKEMIANELSQNSHILFRNQFDKAIMEKYGSMTLPAETIKKLFFAEAENPDEAYAAQENGIKHEIIETNLLKALEIKVEADEVLEMAKFLTARQFAQYGMAGIDEEIITRYAKEQLEKAEIRNQLTQQVLTSKLYDAIENAVSLDKQTVSLDDFKKIAQEA
ncbi:trigger factor [uncultured Duncaniella sp.]|jgi:trigger factor|uniref:trigger factor n=1 Tax=Duncaniella dubosii TaxID=2518971 RepID=UPI0025B0A53C|nr:trigger factor [uncultured Duncaniella sp.]